jgi:hypothetical protein
VSPPAMARDVVVKLRTAGRTAFVRVWRYIVWIWWKDWWLRGCDVFVLRGSAWIGDGGLWLVIPR